MKISLTRFIKKHTNPADLSFAEMRDKFIDSGWNKTPTAKQLQESDDVILYHYHRKDSDIRILKSGYVLAEYNHNATIRTTVIPAKADCCYYPDESGHKIRISVSEYSAMPFQNALEMLLMFRIDKNANARERNRVSQYVDSTGEYHKKKERPSTKLVTPPITMEKKILDYLEPDTEPDFRIQCKRALADALTHLTEKQAEVVQLYYFENLTEQEIADKLGIARTSVQDRLLNAKKKLKKRCTAH